MVDIEKRKLSWKKYYLKNKENIDFLEKRRESKIKSYYKNREKMLLKAKVKYESLSKEEKEKKLLYWKKYRENPEVIKRNLKNKRKLYHSKHKFDPNWRLKKNLRRRILLALKGNNKSKNTMKLLGCSIEELWQHLESKFQLGMTRNNHGKWHIDHIKPCASFDLSDPEQQKICFHYTNLQPLWSIDNIKKSDKYEKEIN